jgi:hypothetical protein
MRRNGRRDDIYYEDGTLTVFRWIGFDRFFPPDQEKIGKVLRGCSSVLHLLFLYFFHESDHWAGLSRELYASTFLLLQHVPH